MRFRSESRNRELVRPSADVLRFLNHLQSSCNMGFVARNHQLSVQLHLSEIGGLGHNPSYSSRSDGSSLGQLASDSVEFRFKNQESRAGATTNKALEMFYATKLPCNRLVA